ncbi:MAG: YibE/F family protein [Spirochaetota bacterium]
MKKIILFIAVAFTLPLSAQDFTHQTDYAKANITSIDKRVVIDEDTGERYYETVFSLKILNGRFKGTEKKVTFQGKDTMPDYVKYRKGETIYIGFNATSIKTETDTYISLYDIDNSNGIIVLLLLLCATVIIIGRLRGFFSMIALVVTIGMIFFIFVPLTLRGFPPIISALLVSFVSIIITIPIITGISKKALSAMAGASAGILIATASALVCGYTMHLSGLITDDMIEVFYMAEADINIRDIALSGMIIAGLGAIMDVSVSISSSTAELFEANPNLEFRRAFLSVLTIGRDILGSMVNTLILAYAGSSLALLLVISMKFDSSMPIMMILSHNVVLVEIVKSFVGSFGMFLSIPATAFIAVKLNLKASSE